MTLASSNIRLCLALALFLFSNGQAEELLQPPKSMVRYKLSNLQTRDSVLGTGFSFDYRRTQEGEGVPRLVVRTNHGESRVLGLQIQIEDSGTIRLRDLTGRSTWLLDMHDDEGIAFYFVVDPIPGIRGKQQYLVSNVVKNKAFNLKVKGRRLTEEEKAEFERQQLAKLPPKSVPEGFLRVVAETKLLPGTQVKFGVMGEWKDAEIVDFPSANTVRILEKDASQVRLMVRNEWLAISEQTAAKIKSDPEQFISRVQTLPKSNLVLKQGIVPIPTPVDLLPGTPLLRDHYGRWQDVYFLSCDNVSVRVLSKENGQSKVEFVAISVLAVRAQSLRDQKDEKIKLAYAANVADAETIGTEVKLGTSGTSSMAGGGFAGAITNLPKTIKKPKATQGEEAKNPFETGLQ